MQKKKGISLIVLVITIIVMIILAAAIILSLNNSGIINKANEAVEKSDLAGVKNLAALKWAEVYLDENIEDDEKEKYVLARLSQEGIDTDKYEIIVTDTGVDVTLKLEVPDEWKENVTEIVNTVPIPKGFAASPYEGEKRKNYGLVIYELNDGETAIPSDETQYTSWTTRNQYVWVPVEKETFVTTFVRKDFYANNNNDSVTDSNGRYYSLGSRDNMWEVVVDIATNLPNATQSELYMSDATLAEVQAMYASVKEYGGFYIARYEAGIDSVRTSEEDALLTGSSVHSKMGKIPYNNILWSTSNTMNVDTGAAVEVARSLYAVDDTTNTTGVVSTLTYGVQWDRTLVWWQESNSKFSLTNGVTYGNFRDHEIKSAEDLNEGALVSTATPTSITSYVSKDSSTLPYPKEVGTSWRLSTGALKAANVNNIYDMAGNVAEWTMEGNDRDRRVNRGGTFGTNGDGTPGIMLKRTMSKPASIAEGFRVSLYIKK